MSDTVSYTPEEIAEKAITAYAISKALLEILPSTLAAFYSTLASLEQPLTKEQAQQVRDELRKHYEQLLQSHSLTVLASDPGVDEYLQKKIQDLLSGDLPKQ